jgi:hypothetical protein
MTPEELQQYQFSYVTQNVLLLFKDEPTLEAVDEVRKILNIVCDSLIRQGLADMKYAVKNISE